MTRTQLYARSLLLFGAMLLSYLGFAQTTTLPDFSVQVTNARYEQPQAGYPRDPYTVSYRINRTIIGTNLNASNLRVFNVKAYLSTDSILSADDLGNANQDVNQNNFSLNTDAEILLAFKPKQTGTNYILFKIDNENVIAESNENNNVSNAFPINVYFLNCASNGIAPWNEWISNVKLNTINNTSEKTRYNVSPVVNGYSNFLDISTSLNKGQTYPLSITPSLGYPTYQTNLFSRIWIDYNQNGSFEDAEIVFAANNLNRIVTQNITVPTTALIGTTAMRVSIKAGAYPTACEVFEKGEVEDYTVNIQAGTIPTDKPDLVITNITVDLTPNPATNGTSYLANAKITFKNVGTAAVTGITAIPNYLWLSANPTDTVLNGTYATSTFGLPPTLAVGASATVTAPTFSVQSANCNRSLYWQVAANVAVGNSRYVSESNFANNFLGGVPLVCPTQTSSCRTQDSLQLVRLYNATNGANWTRKWNLATPINTWYGVILTTNGCVERIDLNVNNLVGTLPNLSMSKLNVLYLGGNILTGSIPNFNLPNLNILILNSNSLSGTIPNFNLPTLQDIDLGKNQLTGAVPSISGLPIISSFQVYENKLTGSMPNFSSPTLRTLNVNKNQLTGTIPNLSLPNLDNLNLSNNLFTGSLPNLTLPNISGIFLSDNKLSGCIPASLKVFCGKALDFSGNTGLSNQNFATFCSNDVGSCNAPLPDFRMTSITQAQGSDLTTTTYPAVTGGFGINYTVVNNGGAYTSPVTAFIYLSKDTILDSRDSLFTKLLAGATGTFLAGGPVPNLPDGDYYLIGKANGDNAVAESNVNNNVFVLKTPTVKIRSTNVSDLSILLSANRGFYQPFTTLTYLLVVENRGTTPFSNIKVEFKFPANTVSGGAATPSVGTWQEWCAGGVQCFTWTIPSIAAGANAQLNVPLFILNTNAPIVATAKLLNSTPVDANTMNNSATYTITPAPVAPTTQSLAFQVPTQLIPVIIQRISPNPTEGDVQIKLDSWTKQTVDFNFSDITGKTIYSEKRDLEKGLNKLNFEVFHLSQGVYFIQTNVGKGKDVPTKFVKM